ncbi:MAG TPA: hypothetical protein VJZ27_19040, partial [Aggregatilineales bacterium]|nr:hypothetical protein [Aggregatilineales bacterium]
AFTLAFVRTLESLYAVIITPTATPRPTLAPGVVPSSTIPFIFPTTSPYVYTPPRSPSDNSSGGWNFLLFVFFIIATAIRMIFPGGGGGGDDDYSGGSRPRFKSSWSSGRSSSRSSRSSGGFGRGGRSGGSW